ncbi:MAG: hypothetical protein HXM47_09500, partial [Pseudoleptotrichia goodfellowii]|nr:hypothetical protein [Pseudoleptotrichia goodfellowii]
MDKYFRYEEQEIEIKLNGEKVNGYMIREFEINSDVNKHTEIKIVFEVAENSKSKYEEANQIEDCALEVNAVKNGSESQKINIFTGQIKDSCFKVYGNNGYQYSLVGYSKSELIDRERKYRVFQDVNLTYEEIIMEIISEYKDKKIEVVMNKKVKGKIGDIIFQFDETDYEFLVRLISHLNMGIINTDAGVLSFGFTDAGESKNEDMIHANYGIMRKGKDIIYRIESSQIFNNGNTIAIEINNGKNEFKIKKTKIYVDRGLLFSEYEMVSENYEMPKILNEKIKGSVIEGIVEKVFEKNNIAVMNIRFYEGLSKYGKAYKDYGILRYTVPYSTFYSQTNTGFFCTPEVNDVVDVFFL